MSDTSKAVFLSYASEDTEAAKRICEALREAGVEVWFDQSELRGGDAWDAKIRKQIKECALFVPVISANTQSRGEGYFRLEWKLAVDRSHLLADDHPFLFPVVIDDTPEGTARVPDRFRDVQWTRLNVRDTPPMLAARVAKLLAKGQNEDDEDDEDDEAEDNGRRGRRKSRKPPKPAWLRVAWSIIGLTMAAYWGLQPLWRSLGWMHSKRPLVEATTDDEPTPPAAAPEHRPAEKSKAPAAEQKSIAVLPFANMSEEKDSEFFTDGIQEDILTNLSNLREVRVVSRTSVLQYRGTTKPIRQIASELGVAYILEGSVRRVGNKVRVTGQLIHAASDEHVWAKSYDRDLTDVFGIQSELAQAIAVALQAAISPEERAALERKPTENSAAYDLYLKARALRHVHSGEAKMKATESLLAQAVEKDPNFAEAWAELADCRAEMFYLDYDGSVELQEAGKAAIAQALRLAPDNPTVIGMVGNYYFHSSRDYARATEQYLRLAQLQPNAPLVFLSLGTIQLREGRWGEAAANFRRAHELDAGNPEAINALFGTLFDGRHYAESEALAREQLKIRPDAAELRFGVAAAAYLGRGSVAEMDDFFHRQFDPSAGVPVFDLQKKLARMRGDYAEAVRLDREHPFDENGQTRWSQEMDGALDLVGSGDLAGARARAEATLPAMTTELVRQPNNSWLHCWLAQAYALLGDKERALFHAGRAVAIVPESRDATIGVENAVQTAAIFAWAGQRDHALAELARLIRVPHAALYVRPDGKGLYSWAASWQPLENDARFQAILADPASRAPTF